ncbi:hypothetical protein Y032_0007g3433 [Ancylostoma ceylanicum]|uniref:Uncharacterized protein n=1 Tax=Ancylostoma ceylanicum TaxID=53326 RepID=A0A016VMZ7_9BILA|nr:hypothetical protein Y032_0007g3433 [Ancylostoma ceylanicum]
MYDRLCGTSDCVICPCGRYPSQAMSLKRSTHYNCHEHEPETLARKTLEAFWIMARIPKISRKDECIAVTNELAP